MDDRRVMTDDWLAVADDTPTYNGLRMSADEYERLPEDGRRYEVIDGVVVMAPSPDAGHQYVASQIERQIQNYLQDRPLGWAMREMDVRLDNKHLYRPDLFFVGANKMPRLTRRIHLVPDMVLEVLSPGTESVDLSTKRDDYERFGVEEYWIVDVRRRKFTFLRLGARGFVAVPVRGNKFASKAIPGFVLDIAAVKRAMAG